MPIKGRENLSTPLKASFLRGAQVLFEALKQIALSALLKTWLEVPGFPSEAEWFIIFIFLLFYGIIQRFLYYSYLYVSSWRSAG